MDLKDYLRLLRVRRGLIVVCAALGLAAAALATLAATPVYQSKAVIFVSTGDSGTVGGAYTGSLFTQARVKSYSEIIKSPEVLGKVVDELGLAESPESLAGRVTASAPLDTVLLNVAVTDTDPVRARDLTNAVSTQFTRTVSELERGNDETTALVKASVVTPAQVSGTPVSPRPKLNLALGLLVGLAIGVGGAVCARRWTRPSRAPMTLQDHLGAADAGRHPLRPGSRASGRWSSHASPSSPRAEAFRQLRTNLQFVDIDRPPRSVVITSALPARASRRRRATWPSRSPRRAPGGARRGDLRRPTRRGLHRHRGRRRPHDVLIGAARARRRPAALGRTGSCGCCRAGRCPLTRASCWARQMRDLMASSRAARPGHLRRPAAAARHRRGRARGAPAAGCCRARQRRGASRSTGRRKRCAPWVRTCRRGAQHGTGQGPGRLPYGYGYGYGYGPDKAGVKAAKAADKDAKAADKNAAAPTGASFS